MKNEIQIQYQKMMSSYLHRQFFFKDRIDDNFKKYYLEFDQDKTYTNNAYESLIIEMYENLVNNIHEKELSANQNTSYSLSLIKQIIKTNFTINELNLNCEYYNAHVLLRKQLESATRIHELNTKEKRSLEWKTPNTGNTFNGLYALIKKELSEFVHVSDSHKLISLNPINRDYQERFDSSLVSKILEISILINFTIATGIFNLSKSFSQNTADEIHRIFVFTFKYSKIKNVITDTKLIRIKADT